MIARPSMCIWDNKTINSIYFGTSVLVLIAFVLRKRWFNFTFGVISITACAYLLFFETGHIIRQVSRRGPSHTREIVDFYEGIQAVAMQCDYVYLLILYLFLTNFLVNFFLLLIAGLALRSKAPKKPHGYSADNSRVQCAVTLQ